MVTTGGREQSRSRAIVEPHDAPPSGGQLRWRTARADKNSFAIYERASERARVGGRCQLASRLKSKPSGGSLRGGKSKENAAQRRPRPCSFPLLCCRHRRQRQFDDCCAIMIAMELLLPLGTTVRRSCVEASLMICLASGPG